MGFWDSISYSANSVKKFFWSSYPYGHGAVTNIDNVVRVEAVQKLNHYFQDKETRTEMGHLASHFAKKFAVRASREFLKVFPGGGLLNDVISQSVPDKKKSVKSKNEAELKDYEEKIKKLQGEAEDYKEKTKNLESFVNRMDKQLRGCQADESIEHEFRHAPIIIKHSKL